MARGLAAPLSEYRSSHRRRAGEGVEWAQNEDEEHGSAGAGFRAQLERCKRTAFLEGKARRAARHRRRAPCRRCALFGCDGPRLLLLRAIFGAREDNGGRCGHAKVFGGGLVRVAFDCRVATTAAATTTTLEPAQQQGAKEASDGVLLVCVGGWVQVYGVRG